MKIKLFEGDELSQPDGKPRHIYLSIEGKKMILPTSKTILDLLEMGIAPVQSLNKEKELPSSISQAMIKSNEIEREDLVTCIKVLPRGEGANIDIVEGGTYRVISIVRQSIGETIVARSYEVIDDSAPVQRRIFVFPQEIVLFKKHTVHEPPRYQFEEIRPCGYCSEPVVMILDSNENRYKGNCGKCGKPLEMERAKTSEKSSH